MKPADADLYFEYLLSSAALPAKRLALQIGVAQSTVSVHVARLKSEQKIYIAHWTKIGCTVIAYYRWGNGKNAQRPARMPEKIKREAFKKRLHADPERYERKLKRDQIRHVIDRARVRPATWFSVLGAIS